MGKGRERVHTVPWAERSGEEIVRARNRGVDLGMESGRGSGGAGRAEVPEEGGSSCICSTQCRGGGPLRRRRRKKNREFGSLVGSYIHPSIYTVDFAEQSSSPEPCWSR